MDAVGSTIVFKPSLEEMSDKQWVYAYQLMNHLQYVRKVELGDMKESDFRLLIVGTYWKNMATRVTAESVDWEAVTGDKLKAVVLKTLGAQGNIKIHTATPGRLRNFGPN